MVVHVVYWPKSYDKGFFDWIKLTDIYKVKLFFGVIPKSLPKKKTITYCMKICNFDSLKQALVVWFWFGANILHAQHPFIWIYHMKLQVHFVMDWLIPIRTTGDFSCVSKQWGRNRGGLESRSSPEFLVVYLYLAKNL